MKSFAGKPEFVPVGTKFVGEVGATAFVKGNDIVESGVSSNFHPPALQGRVTVPKRSDRGLRSPTRTHRRDTGRWCTGKKCCLVIAREAGAVEYQLNCEIANVITGIQAGHSGWRHAAVLCKNWPDNES